MKCHNCGHENTEGAKFCSQCGSGLTITCQVCGTVATPGDKFCSNCGAALPDGAPQPEPVGEVSWPQEDLARYLPEELLAKMRSAREGHAMEGERRTVTMLFADIQGSTSSAERLDPEDWAEIMNGAFERLISPIYRYEGTLAQLRGDAVLAFFGAPIAHEDDPVRALRAGLEMVEAMAGYSEEVESRWGVPAHIRVGVNTGLVVVGAMGSDLRVEYNALGDAINVAARMEQTADPDTVRVTGHTLALTNGLFEAVELGSIDVKGKSDSVPAFRVVRYVGSSRTTEETPIVGRSEELSRLGEMRYEVLGGSGHIASIIGEAGVGKSRLLTEFADQTERSTDVSHRFDQSGAVNWLMGSSRSYDSGNHFSTVGDMLVHWWFAEGATPDYETIETAIEAEGVSDPDMAAYLGYISRSPLPDEAASFIGSLETQVLNAKANAAAISYLRAVAGRRPTFLVLEDLHWADDLSLALVEGMMDITETDALGLIIAMRPYRAEPTWRIHEVAERDHHHRYSTVDLDPLDESESTALLEGFLANADLSAEARQRILDRSEGNPLYIEQIVRSMQEVGAADVDPGAVPTSLNGLLTARLDRLDESARYFVQMASVLGSEFDREMLAALVEVPDVDADVTDLLRKGILTEMPGHPGHLGFRHALIQEVAYETILKRTRRQLHRRVADHLIASEGGARDIARHLLAAEETETAYPYLIKAGTEATRSMALADAISLLNMAIDNTPDDADPELIVQSHDSLGEAYALIPDLSQAAASYQRLFEFGETNRRPRAQVAALNRLAYATASLGADLDKAAGYLADARRIAEENDDEIGLAEYHMNSCMVASLGGNVGKAVDHDEETVRLGEQSGVASIRLSGLVRRATNYITLLDFERGLPAVETALEEARRAGMEEGLAIVEMAGVGMMKMIDGDFQEALELLERTVVTLERFGSFYLGLNQRMLAYCLFELGNIEDALGRYVDVKRAAVAGHQPFVAATGSSGMALVYANAGIDDEIPKFRAEVDESVNGPIGEFLASTAYADLGFASLATGDTDQAADDFSRGLSVSSTTQFVERPRILAGRALAHLDAEDLEAARSDLDKATAFVEGKPMGGSEALLGYVEGRILGMTGDFARADVVLAEAQERAMTRGQRLALVQILAERARLAVAAGEGADAETHAAAAKEAVEAIARGVADEVLRKSFTARWLGRIAANTAGVD